MRGYRNGIARGPLAPRPFCSLCAMRPGMLSLRQLEELLKKYKARRNPVTVREEMLVVYPLITEIRRASNLDLRQGIFRMKKHLHPPAVSWLEEIPAQGGEVPSNRPSLLKMAARSRSVGSQAEYVALESLDRIRLSRASHMKYKHLLGGSVVSTDSALA